MTIKKRIWTDTITGVVWLTVGIYSMFQNDILNLKIIIVLSTIVILILLIDRNIYDN